MEGDSMEIGFNNRYLLDALRYSKCEKLRLEIKMCIRDRHTHQRSQDHCEESHILSFRPARTQGIYFIKKVFAVR